MDTKTRPIYFSAHQTYISDLDTHTDRKCGDGKKVFHTNRTPKKATVAIFISDKIDF